MKNKIAIASAFLAAASFSNAEIVINDFLSFEGFVDMAYTSTNMDQDNNNKQSDNSYEVDQVEIDWLFDFDPVTAQIDLEYENGSVDNSQNNNNSNSNDGDTEVEQAFVTYHFDGDLEGFAVTAGRYASMLGFEAFEPTGLYQYSLAYDIQSLGTGYFGQTTDISIIPTYAQGIKVTYENDDTFFGISVQDQSFSDDDDDADRFGGSGDSSWAVEIAAAYEFGDGFTAFLGGAYEDAQNHGAPEDGDTYTINTYVTYETGAWLFAAELNYGESQSGAFALGSQKEEVLQGLLMANYVYSDVASVTGRFSYMNNDNTTSGADQEFTAFKYTLAHNYAFTDNLLLVTEVSYVDGDIDANSNKRDYNSLLGAVELLFSF